MAARRLIIVLVVLFGVSVAAAAIAPKRQATTSSDESTSSSTESTAEEPAPAGGDVEATLAASAEEPPEVDARPGDHLQLTVSTKVPGQLEIAALGLIEDATPEAPALFDILLREEGTLAITDPARGEVVGRILVEEAPGASNSPRRDRRSPAEGRSTQ